jgi:hypothetical protein
MPVLNGNRTCKKRYVPMNPKKNRDIRNILGFFDGRILVENNAQRKSTLLTRKGE